MELRKWSKTDDPDLRCDFNLTNGSQCGNLAEPSVSRCPMHGANKQLEATERSSLRLYRLAKFQKRADELTDHAKVKGLREEIAILRILLENKFNQCDDEHQLLLSAGPISDMVMKIEKVVSSCHRLENSLGGLLDKTRIKQIANEMLNSVSTRAKEVLSTEDVDEDKISEKLLELIAADLLECFKEQM